MNVISPTLKSRAKMALPAFALAAFACLAISTPVLAAGTTHDHAKMHAPPNPAGFLPRAATYTPSVWPYTPPTIGDGSDSRGGRAPAKYIEQQSIESNFDTRSWSVSNYYPHVPLGQGKFRTTCNFSHIANDDPIVFPNKPGVSHTHMFFGNTLTNADSTYKSLRTSGGSTCGGGPINRSAYWFPALLKDNAIGDGKTMAIKFDFATVYYISNEVGRERLTRLYRGLNYVFGFNPADPGDLRTKNEVAAANKNGIYNSYRYRTNGFVGWKCEATNGSYEKSPVPLSAFQPYLRNADGTPTLICPTTERIAVGVSSPTCWDGQHLTSPDGRTHVRYALAEINSGRNDICPQGWYYIPELIVSLFFSHNGPDDYKEWYLASDRMPGAKTFLNGQSFHMDWFGAWDYGIMRKWMSNCIGLTINQTLGKAQSCIDTQFGDGSAGIVQASAPDRSRTPQINLSIKWADQGKDRYLPIP